MALSTEPTEHSDTLYDKLVFYPDNPDSKLETMLRKIGSAGGAAAPITALAGPCNLKQNTRNSAHHDATRNTRGWRRISNLFKSLESGVIESSVLARQSAEMQNSE